MFLVGHAVGQQLFTDLSSDLKGIMASIEEHGELISNTLSDNKEAETLEKNAEEETNKNILTAIQVMTSAISDGHSKVSDAITNGNNQVSTAITAGNNQVSDAIDNGQDKVAGAITNGNDELTAAVTTGFDNTNKAIYVSFTNITKILY